MLLLEVLFSIVLILICNRRTRGVFFSPEEHNTKNLKVLAVAKQRKTTYLVPTYKRHVFTIDWLVDRVVSMADHAAGRPGFEPWPCRTEIAAEEKRNVLSFHGNSKKTTLATTKNGFWRQMTILPTWCSGPPKQKNRHDPRERRHDEPAADPPGAPSSIGPPTSW